MVKDARKAFADSLSSLFREPLECTMDAEVESRLLKAAVASSGRRVCGWKRLSEAINDKTVTTWWNQKVKDDIQHAK